MIIYFNVIKVIFRILIHIFNKTENVKHVKFKFISVFLFYLLC